MPGQLEIHGSWSWNGSETWRRAVDLITGNAFVLDLLINGRYELGQWKEAFQNLRDGKDIKALIYPNGKGWL